MKKVILILAVLVISSGFLWADGFGLISRITLDTNNATDQTDTGIFLKPYYSMMMDETMELTPFLSFDMDITSVSGTVVNKYYSIGVGTGLYFHFIQKKIIDLSAGADLGAAFTWDPDISPYFEIDLNIGVPVVLDIKFSESFLVRISQTIAYLNFNFTRDNTTNTTSTVLDTLWNGFSPSFGFMFLF